MKQTIRVTGVLQIEGVEFPSIDKTLNRSAGSRRTRTSKNKDGAYPVSCDIRILQAIKKIWSTHPHKILSSKVLYEADPGLEKFCRDNCARRAGYVYDSVLRNYSGEKGRCLLSYIPIKGKGEQKNQTVKNIDIMNQQLTFEQARIALTRYLDHLTLVIHTRQERTPEPEFA